MRLGVEQAVDGGPRRLAATGIGVDARVVGRHYAEFVLAFLRVTDNGPFRTKCARGGRGKIRSEGAEVASRGNVLAKHALAADVKARGFAGGVGAGRGDRRQNQRLR